MTIHFIDATLKCGLGCWFLISLFLSRVVNYKPDTDNDAKDYYEEYIAKVKNTTVVELGPGHG
jgi:hypothetical protein